MKKDIHPNYGPAVARCACGNVIHMKSTVAEISVESCSSCHPFYTGKSKANTAQGRIDTFNKKYKNFKAPAGA